MASGALIKAPRAPMPPALATEIERLTGHAPAIGASRIGSFSPYLRQKDSARARGAEVFGMAAEFVGASSFPGWMWISATGHSAQARSAADSRCEVRTEPAAGGEPQDQDPESKETRRGTSRRVSLFELEVGAARYFLDESSLLPAGAISSLVGVATSPSAPGADPPKRNLRPSGKVMLTPTPLCSKALD